MIKQYHKYNIFIDTSTFHQHQFCWYDSQFQYLKHYQDINKVVLYTSEITMEEIKSNIQKKFNEAYNSFNAFKNKSRVLKILDYEPFVNLYEEVDKELALKTLLLKFHDYFKDLKTVVIDTSNVSSNKIFKRYFSNEPPFSQKKKSEFPDAFVLEAINLWCKKKNEKMYVISNDSDMKEYCKNNSNLDHLDTINQLFDLIVKKDDELSTHIVKIIDNNTEKISELVKDKFNYFGFWLEEQEGDVLDINVRSVDIEQEHILMVDQLTVIVGFDTNIEFEAEVEYDDLDTASYDSEDKVLIPWRKIHKNLNRTVDVLAEVKFSFSVDDEKTMTILDINFNKDDISINVDEDSYYDLK